ncbi:transketolase [bacterium]|nr:transketolase [candidate division CSSED10-310 bacterium]
MMTIEQKTIQTIRTLAIDAVQKANSGHPGAPMGMAPAAYSLWRHALIFSPDDPYWPNRDRFVLSAGHASTLLYALIHLTGVKDPDRSDDATHQSVTIDDLKSFRQLGSRCPGHPEFGDTPGVETTTGPLGQGLAASVGMAIAEKWLEASFNTPDFSVIDYNIYALCGDGCMMEGISHEAAALAGHLKLSNLCWIYDSNRITIEGSTRLAMTENVARRFLAYGWSVMTVEDGNDLAALKQAFLDVGDIDDRPVLVIVKSHIAFGSPNKQDSESAHGSPLGVEEVRLTKQAYGWPDDSSFLVPDEVINHLSAEFGARGNTAAAAWNEVFARYSLELPEKAAMLRHIFDGTLPDDWTDCLPDFPAGTAPVATRSASGKVLNALSSAIPWLIGGSADLGPSNNTLIKNAADFSAVSFDGRNIRFGVREFCMAAIANGMANAGLRPYVATFLVFSDYARPAIRLSALMQLPVLYILTHDSISVGEDGPTHQPVEHLAALRAIPGLTVIRPADANELNAGYRSALEDMPGPVALALSRQNLPVIDRDEFADAVGARQGAYVLADNSGTHFPQCIIIASGSEVHLAIQAYRVLSADNVKLRLVSMPSWELFEAQSDDYRDEVLPPEVTNRIVVEQGVAMGWERYAGPGGIIMAIDRFGVSAPGPVAEEYFGYTVENLVGMIRGMIG